MATIKAEFEINDVLASVTCEVTGHYVPATFHHEAEDEREVNAEKIELFDVDGDLVNATSNFLNKIYKHIDNNFLKIYKSAQEKKDVVYLSDLI